MEKMDWSKLISSKRLGSENFTQTSDARTEFERDLDRIIFSTAFRRLQGKTQVFPIPKSDFVHTRLTHSIEVASIGRSLGKLIGRFVLTEIGEKIKEANKQEEISADSFGDIVAAACLSHDIGNPPFGHSGEDSFRHYFLSSNNNKSKKIFSTLSPSEKDDFFRFEGNAEGFRILTNEHPSKKEGGLRLTYSTIASFCKYTCESGLIDHNELSKKVEKRRSSKKVGFFQKEKEIFESVANELGLLKLSDDNVYYTRHPLAFAVEAADNIGYQIMDLEDAHKLKLISTDEVIDLLKPFANSISSDPCNINDLLSISDKNEKVGAFRAKAINSLIYQCYDVFKENYSKIMCGEFDFEITDLIKQKEDLINIENVKPKIFSYEKVVAIESSGRYVITGLLDIYIDAFENMDKKYANNIISLMPEHLRVMYKDSSYDALLKICIYISRMTDIYAIDQFQILTGHKFPEII